MSASSSSNILNTPLEYLKGVGPARADLLKKELAVFTVTDLLYHFPFRYVDRSRFYKTNEISGELAFIQLKGIVSNFRMEGKARAQRLLCDFTDTEGRITLVWFQGISWIKQSIQSGKEYIVFGKPNIFNGAYSLIHPQLETSLELSSQPRLQPVYSLTEKLRSRNFDSKAIMKIIRTIVDDPGFHIEEFLPENVISENKLLSRKEAFRLVHFPSNQDEINAARARLKFEELFLIQMRLLKTKSLRKTITNGIRFEKIGDYFNTFYEKCLPFELSNAQKRVVKEIRTDVKSGVQMNRLLQGDVGSGKTVVALMSALIAADNAYQTCLMAPTEILARQHFNSISELTSLLDFKIGILTGSAKSKERKKVLAELESGELHLLIGTHAILEDPVVFKDLGLAIIDEQHRFGVEQRSRLWKKNKYPPHILVMTATPIPRTLAMTLYGDLDTSVIDELPKGRKEIQTFHKYDSNRLSVFGFLKQQISLGRQIYIVYPLIEESEKMDYKNLMEGFEAITRSFPAPEYHVSMVHGKMKAADRDFEMARFIKGETHIMIATTVIEVGVNVPNASVMVIESAERFGLSQLHQLRGRVGRGADQSYCILMSGNKLSAESRERIKTMVETSDGFKIAETDMKLRGPGDLEGTKQSGLLDLRIADISEDGDLIKLTRSVAERILENDPELKRSENERLLKYLDSRPGREKWSRIS